MDSNEKPNTTKHNYDTWIKQLSNKIKINNVNKTDRCEEKSIWCPWLPINSLWVGRTPVRRTRFRWLLYSNKFGTNRCMSSRIIHVSSNLWWLFQRTKYRLHPPSPVKMIWLSWIHSIYSTAKGTGVVCSGGKRGLSKKGSRVGSSRSTNKLSGLKGLPL